MFEVFACLYLTILPLIYWGGPNGVREYLSICITAVFCFALWWGGAFPAIAMPVLLFAGWIAMSVLWSGYKDHSIFDCLMILSCLAAFYAVQQIDKATALFMCFAPAAGIAATMIPEEFRYRRALASIPKKHSSEYHIAASSLRPGGIFGNCNHAGVYLSLNVLTGLWLAENVTLWFLPFVLVVAVAIILSRSRNAQAATLIGIASIFFFMELWEVWLCLLFFGASALFRIKNRAWSERNLIFGKALKLVAAKPIFGWGLNTFRVEHSYHKPFVQTHRVHNDYLEFLFDIGIIGVALLGLVYWSADWSFSPLLSAQLLIGLGTAFWFFTFREIHTAMPVWGLLGVLVPVTAGAPVSLPALLMIAMPYVLWVHVGKRIAGLFWWVVASRQTTKEKQYDGCMRAIKYDQNSQYMTRGAYLASLNGELNMAWDLCARSMYRFDGITTLCSVMAQMAKAAMLRGAFNLAVLYNKMSLQLAPDFPVAVEFEKELERVKQNLEAKRRAGNAALEMR